MKFSRFVALATAICAAIGVGTLPAVASSTDPSPFTAYLIGPPNNEAGYLRLIVDAPSAVTSVTAHIMDGSNDLLDVSDTQLLPCPRAGRPSSTCIRPRRCRER